MTIKVLLVDDQNLVKMGLCSLLQLSSDIEVIAQLDDGCEVVEALRKYQPDIVLLDIRMPRMDGIDVLKAMQVEVLSTPVLMLSTFDEHDLVLQCIQLGAKGYLRKDVRLEDLMAAIKTIVAGECWYQPAVTHQVFKHFDYDSEDQLPVEPLSRGELQVLRLVAAGYSNSEIAQALFKSEGTIRNQMSVVLAKLNVRDRTRAVLKAIENGII